jgi:AraC-like DNA-binding protein
VNLRLATRDAGPPGELVHAFEVHAAAPDQLDATSADAVCFDYDYPDMAGLRLIPRTKKRTPSVPILMLTLQHSEDLAVWAFRARVFDYLVKPLARREVERCAERLADALAARRAQSERVAGNGAAPVPVASRYVPASPGEQRLQPAIMHITRHFTERVRGSEVAALCNMTPYHFSREFKAAFGVTFQDFLLNFRIAEARRLLANPRMSVTDVAAAAGFPDPSYFARAFKRRTGRSPSEYREAGAEIDTVATARMHQLVISP